MKKIYRILSLLLVFILVASVVGCGKSATEVTKKVNYDDLKKENGLASGDIVENNNYILTWDNDRAFIKLTEKSTGNIWSSIPYDFYTSGKKSGKVAIKMGSPLILSYFNVENNSAVKTVNGYTGIIENGKVVCKAIKNGMRVQYFFDKLKIMIPVDFVLRDNGISVSINLRDIVEEDNLVYKISLSPFLCHAANSNNKSEQYIVVPSGSGALMYTYENGDAREYSEKVYGDDPACYKNEKLINTESIRVPMFGAKNGDTALCGIIEEGAACSSIDAIVGDSGIGYSSVYPTFTIRGSNISAIDFQGGNVTEVETISKELSGYKTVTVAYYPLTGDNADYVGMASVYREYANDAFKKTYTNKNDTRLTLKILGGLQISDSMLGIPYKKTVAATTFEEVLDIVEQVNKLTNEKFDVILSGFGDSGLDIGKIAGGFEFAKVFGGKKPYKKLKDYCNNNGIGLYSDFDIIRFNKSGQGFSKTFDAAKASNLFTAYQYQYSVALRNIDEKDKRYVLLNRSLVGKAVTKLLALSDRNEIEGLSLSTLGSIAYSDYANPSSYVRGNTEKEMTDIIKRIKNQGISVMVSNANAYAAASADKVTDAPVTSSMFDALDCDIPLYQIIFKGLAGVSSAAINTAKVPQEQLLKALEGGSGIEFVLSANYITEFATTKHSAFAVSLFSDNIDSIKECIQKTGNFYDAIDGTVITGHNILSNGLHYTEFDNGTQLWVNYGKVPVTIDDGTVEAYGFMVKEGAK